MYSAKPHGRILLQDPERVGQLGGPWGLQGLQGLGGAGSGRISRLPGYSLSRGSGRAGVVVADYPQVHFVFKTSCRFSMGSSITINMIRAKDIDIICPATGTFYFPFNSVMLKNFHFSFEISSICFPLCLVTSSSPLLGSNFYFFSIAVRTEDLESIRISIVFNPPTQISFDLPAVLFASTINMIYLQEFDTTLPALCTNWGTIRIMRKNFLP
jgi:hypothetical protein